MDLDAAWMDYIFFTDLCLLGLDVYIPFEAVSPFVLIWIMISLAIKNRMSKKAGRYKSQFKFGSDHLIML